MARFLCSELLVDTLVIESGCCGDSEGVIGVESHKVSGSADAADGGSKWMNTHGSVSIPHVVGRKPKRA